MIRDGGAIEPCRCFTFRQFHDNLPTISLIVFFYFGAKNLSSEKFLEITENKQTLQFHEKNGMKKLVKSLLVKKFENLSSGKFREIIENKQSLQFVYPFHLTKKIQKNHIHGIWNN